MDMEDCSLLTDATLDHLAAGCPNLVELSLSHCELITDEGIRHLAFGLGMNDRLKIVDLDNCPLITDLSMEHLRECQTLQRVELYNCQQITRAGIRKFKWIPAANFSCRSCPDLIIYHHQIFVDGHLLLSAGDHHPLFLNDE